MSSIQASYESEQITKASDPYAVTPEVAPEPDSKPTYTTSESNDDAEKDAIHIDGEAYNGLTKPDPHYATFFSPSDVRAETWGSDFLYSDRERYFRMLSAINRGEQNGPTWEHSELETYRLRKHLVEIIGERLNLTKQQIEHTTARATNVDGEKFGQRLELAVFCTAAYVVHRDESGYAKARDFHPNCPKNDEVFEEVAEEFGAEFESGADLADSSEEDTVGEEEKETESRGLIVTRKSYEAKQNQLQHILDVEIPQNSKEIGQAIEMGDLSENAEYKAGKEKQEMLNLTAAKLKEELEKATIFEPKDIDTSRISFGTKVTLYNHESSEEETYKIFGPWESNPEEHTISYLSPFGGKLWNHTEGEEVKFEINERVYHYTVKSIEAAQF